MVELRLTAKLGAGSCLGPEEGEEMPVDEEEEPSRHAQRENGLGSGLEVDHVCGSFE